MRIFILLAFILVGCGAKTDGEKSAQEALLRNLEGYTIAACLTFQTNPYLKDQGDAWASVIIQRMQGSPEILLDIVEKVRVEVDKGNTAVIRDEASPQKDKALPILFCNEIIYQTEVRAAIQKTMEAFK